MKQLREKVKAKDQVWKCEKKLDVNVWKYRGELHKGSHFPLAAFTRNVGRRSTERYDARKNRWYGEKIGVVVEEPQWRMEASGLYTAVAGECLYTAVAGECRDELISLHAYTPQWRVSAMMN